jgi:hypothetical protein
MRSYIITENRIDTFYVDEKDENIYISHISFGKRLEKAFSIYFDDFGINIYICEKRKRK